MIHEPFAICEGVQLLSWRLGLVRSKDGLRFAIHVQVYMSMYS